jgi:hypothetical protein
MGGSSKDSGQPTVQQQQLETEQALTNANLNLEENSQRKSILNAMMGTRVFQGSALSRALRGNTPGTGGVNEGPAPSRAQNEDEVPIGSASSSLLDTRAAAATPAGGAGASTGAVQTGGGVGRGGIGGNR